jgi:NTE family protein
MTKTHALVLGGGGVAGIAWTIGILAGLADQGSDLREESDFILGTSAGSVVGAQLGSELSYEQLFALQVDPALQARELPSKFDLRELRGRMDAALNSGLSYQDLRKLLARWELEADPPTEAARRAIIAGRLPSHSWPTRRLGVVVIDTETGDGKIFDQDSGIDLLDAITASCSVPTVWPAATIGGHSYIDGGMRSPDNVDYATGFDRVTVVSPVGSANPFPVEFPLNEEIAKLRQDGAQVDLIVPDKPSRAAIGDHPLDIDSRIPAAEAGRAQGRTVGLGR